MLTVCDTESDLQAAHSAGVDVTVGVLFGAHNREQLEREPHTVSLKASGLMAFLA